VADDRPVVVLGAGINGAALARELALSGVPVAVVDADDVASGATAWSTRLIHGGLRYLEYGEIGLVRESLAERDRLVRLAPHLVAPLPFFVPVRGRLGGLRSAAARLVGLDGLARRWRPPRGRGSWTVGTGLALYDLLASDSRWPRHRTVRAGGSGAASTPTPNCSIPSGSRSNCSSMRVRPRPLRARPVTCTRIVGWSCCLGACCG
jgi:glycerol-3-phosphate dehydrogenase